MATVTRYVTRYVTSAPSLGLATLRLRASLDEPTPVAARVARVAPVSPCILSQTLELSPLAQFLAGSGARPLHLRPQAGHRLAYLYTPIGHRNSDRTVLTDI